MMISIGPVLLLCYISLLCEYSSVDAATATARTTVDFPRSACPFVTGCYCIDNDPTRVECHKIGPLSVYSLTYQYPSLVSLDVFGYGDRQIDLGLFKNLTNLRTLRLVDSKLQHITSKTSLDIDILDLQNNWITNFTQLCHLTSQLPDLKILNLYANYIRTIDPCVSEIAVDEFNLSRNEIILINGTLNDTIQKLDLSQNAITTLDYVPLHVTYLNLSSNPLTTLQINDVLNLVTLDLSRTKLFQPPPIRALNLLDAYIDETMMNIFDLRSWNAPKLNRLYLRSNIDLMYVAGSLPASISEFQLTNSKISALPQSFFARVSNNVKLALNGNNFDCDKCVLSWAQPLKKKEELSKIINCTIPKVSSGCELGISSSQESVVFSKYGKDALITCTSYGTPQPTLEWWLYRPSTFLGRFDPATGQIDRQNVSEEMIERYSIVGGGALLINDANRTSVERYVCVVRNVHGKQWDIVRFRLDYTDWYSLSLFDSVFWGALAFTILICAFSFLLNITWILTRKSILWWIHRAERLSRVRKMVEAMEKYRSRQMESLHDKYTRRVQLVRDNYHSQVEQLRGSYTSQAERFRDYRAAQMESVSSHLENIRENYQQQMNRMRDFGSKRAEQLWESYERQVNRMRAFSLQHRLKLMRQYKVKQRYLNKLLESVQDNHNDDAMRKHEEEVRAALELPNQSVPDDEHRLSRSSSFYSLPEYVIGEDGNLRPGPNIPNIRFTRSDIRSGDESRAGTSTTTDSPRSMHTPRSPKE